MSKDRHKVRVAVYVLLIRNNKIFLIRRKNTGWMDGKYGLPAGHLESNETVTEAAVRELQEETGAETKVTNLRFVHLMHRKKEEDFEYIDIFFLCEEWQGEPVAAEPELSDGAGWFSLDKIPNNVIPNVKRAIENYRRTILFSEFIG